MSADAELRRLFATHAESAGPTIDSMDVLETLAELLGEIRASAGPAAHHSDDAPLSWTARTVDLEERSPDELYDGAAPLTVANPTFDLTPPDAIDTYVTEDGEVDAGGIARIADRHRSRRSWQGSAPE